MRTSLREGLRRMPRQRQQLTYNSFSGGIITEASPLTFPDGASIDEQNFELTKQGFRKRRLGLGLISKPQPTNATSVKPKDVNTYIWDNVGATGETYLVVGVKNEVHIYNITESLPGENLVFTSTVDYKVGSTLSFASRAGVLIVASGAEDITVITALGDDLFSKSSSRLKVRDRVGIPDYVRDNNQNTAKVDLRSAEGSVIRPTAPEMYKSGPVSNITYAFTSVSKISDITSGDVTKVRHQLSTGNSNPAFQGFPIGSFILQKEVRTANTLYSFLVVFEDLFPLQTIPSNTTSGSLDIVNGISYSSSLTEAEYNAFLSLTQSLVLTEQVLPNTAHDYNLWNQGWGEERMVWEDSEVSSPAIVKFLGQGDEYPSNADSVNYALYPNAANGSNRTANRFHPKDLIANPPGTIPAPRGRYIIDAIDRGVSRSDVFLKDIIAKGFAPQYGTYVNFEKTETGAQHVVNYAGRVWYSGFSGDTSGSSLPLSDKVLYSQVEDAGLLHCYQEADPTTDVDNDLVETDGGWVNIDGIDQIVDMKVVDTSLLVFGNNGIWAISGIDGNLFSPVSSLVTKITDKGAVNAQSIIVVDRDVIFWAQDGIYRISATGFAEFALESLTKGTINNLIIDLTEEDLENIAGAYDERLERVLWIIDVDTDGTRRELVYHLLFGAFTINSYNNYQSEDNTLGYDLMIPVRLPLFESVEQAASVIVGEDRVLVGTDEVIVPSSSLQGRLSRVAYIGLESTTTGNNIVFSDLVRSDFKDWGFIDADAFMVTGYVSGSDASRQKDVSKLTVHCNRTETTATTTGVNNESSCLIQSQWDWTNNAYANKWSAPFQAYRLSRPQIRGVDEPVAEGIQVVTTNNKLRGRGRVVSLKFSTEENKDCQVLGWSMIAGVNNNV